MDPLTVNRKVTLTCSVKKTDEVSPLVTSNNPEQRRQYLFSELKKRSGHGPQQGLDIKAHRLTERNSAAKWSRLQFCLPYSEDVL
jgi:hypothetical protein